MQMGSQQNWESLLTPHEEKSDNVLGNKSLSLQTPIVNNKHTKLYQQYIVEQRIMQIS